MEHELAPFDSGISLYALGKVCGLACPVSLSSVTRAPEGKWKRLILLRIGTITVRKATIIGVAKPIGTLPHWGNS